MWAIAVNMLQKSLGLSTLVKNGVCGSKLGTVWTRQGQLSSFRSQNYLNSQNQFHSRKSMTMESNLSGLLSLCNELYTCESAVQLALTVRDRFQGVLPGHVVLLQRETCKTDDDTIAGNTNSPLSLSRGSDMGAGGDPKLCSGMMTSCLIQKSFQTSKCGLMFFLLLIILVDLHLIF